MPLLPKALDKALDFTPEDLAANQRGRLTKQQRTRIILMNILPMIIGVGIPFFFLIAVTVIILQRPPEPGNFLFLACLMLMALIFGILVWSGLATLYADLRAGSVSSAVGVAELREKRGPGGRRCFYLKIDTVEFLIEPGVYWSIIAGERYEVFYMPAAMIVVSAVRRDQ